MAVEEHQQGIGIARLIAGWQERPDRLPAGGSHLGHVEAFGVPNPTQRDIGMRHERDLLRTKAMVENLGMGLCIRVAGRRRAPSDWTVNDRAKSSSAH